MTKPSEDTLKQNDTALPPPTTCPEKNCPAEKENGLLKAEIERLQKTIASNESPSFPALRSAPAQGWRLLDAVETIQEGDEWWDDEREKWVIVSNMFFGEPSFDDSPIRRRLPATRTSERAEERLMSERDGLLKAVLDAAVNWRNLFKSGNYPELIENEINITAEEIALAHAVDDLEKSGQNNPYPFLPASGPRETGEKGRTVSS